MNVALSAGVLLTGLAMLEVASRVLLPISPGARFLGPAGNPVEIHDGADAVRMVPNLSFRQLTADYDVWATIGPEGYRAPITVSRPEVIFLGDSFTFGQGLSDDETFAALFCRQEGLHCANLGHPGTGTRRQVQILEHFLREYGWRPREVKLFLLAYAGGLASGNDFIDAVYEAETTKAESPAGEAAAVPGWGVSRIGWPQRVLNYRQLILVHSNLARIAYQQFGAPLRALFSGVSPPNLTLGIATVSRELDHLKQMSEARGFAVTVYVLHPVQDLLRGTYGETLKAVEAAAGTLRVVDTATALLDSPRNYYFPYDGHLNAAGAQRVAEFLAAEETPH